LRAQLDDAELATRFDSELQATQVRGREPAPASDGLPKPVALGCPWQGSYRYVGVALLASPRARAAPQLAAAIATTLLEAGDARACTSSDLPNQSA
jgi:hypothetical protein